MVNELCLDILGTSFTITVEEDQEYLEKVLNQYKAAVTSTQNISGIKEPLNIAVLTGFLLCNEINKMKQEMQVQAAENSVDPDVSWEEQEVEERASRLITKLEHALKFINDGKDIQT